MLFTLPQVLVLFCALLAASLGVLAVLLLRWNRARVELGLYAVLAFAVAFWLATPLLTPVPVPISREILGRLVRALAFLLPAIGFLFLLRILGLGARGLRLAILAPAVLGTALALALPASAGWLDSLAVASLLIVGAGVAWVLARKENRRRDTFLAFAATGILLAGGVAEIASRRLPEPSSASGVLLGTAFLAFTALLLPTAADEERRLFTRATTDALTNLPNRGTFLARSRDELFRAERTRRPLALVLLELDGFAAIRKEKDSAAVDEIVAAYGQGIARAIRGIDVPARWGPDSFAALLVEAEESSTRAAVDRIRAFAAKAAGVTASAGIATRRPLEKTTIEDLIRRAEAALDDATRDGARDASAMETRDEPGAPGTAGA
ncbi:MAG TPA: GGDEF domain-containing protein [Thermoanaerobaculia bacterium]|nr:GGDEF domain-containing protein [Thermoanaerobaculia bacterium]